MPVGSGFLTVVLCYFIFLAVTLPGAMVWAAFGQGLRKLFKNDPVNYYANAMAMGWFDREELKKMLHPDLHQHMLAFCRRIELVYKHLLLG